MSYTQNFNTAEPTGFENADTLDDIIRNVKVALNERFIDILGVTLSASTDPQRVTKIIIPAAGMTIRDSSDSNSLISFSNSGAAIRNASFTGTAPTLPSGSVLTSPTLSGTLTATGANITGGTVAPDTLTVPNGTAITNASLATPALVSPVVSGGTFASPTLTGTTTAGVINSTGNNTFTGNLTVTGNIIAGSLSGPTTVPASNVNPGTYPVGNYVYQGSVTATSFIGSGAGLTGIAASPANIPAGTFQSGTYTFPGTVSAGSLAGSGTSITNIPISGVTNLQTNLDNKANVSHTQSASTITTGTFSAGNFTFPNNLTVSGTLSPATLSGTISASAATLSSPTISGGTISSVTVNSSTLNNTTFTGTVSGLSTNPVSYTYNLSADTSIGGSLVTLFSQTPGTGNWLAILTVNVRLEIISSLSGFAETLFFMSGRTARFGAAGSSITQGNTGSAVLMATFTGTISVSAQGSSLWNTTALANGTTLTVIRIT